MRQLATTGTLPVLQPGDYDQAALERLTSARFPDSLSIDGVRYAAHHPPLYYLVGAGVFLGVAERSLDEQVLALRALSIFFSALTILAVYALALAVLPGRRPVALGAAAFTAGVPMFQFMGAAVENDSLAVLVATVVLLLLVGGLRSAFSRRRCLALGLLCGLVLLTKTTVYAVLPVVLVAFWARSRIEGRAAAPGWTGGALVLASRAAPVATWLRQGALVIGMGVALSGWWFARNALVYGWLDPLGLRQHDAVVVGQPRSVLGWPWLEHLANTTFQSFWAQFGWMGILVDRRLYQVLLALTAVAVLGLIVQSVRLGRGGLGTDRTTAWALGLLGLYVLLVAGEFLVYNLTFIQAQGRYLFAALGPLALFFVLGLAAFVPRRWQMVVPLGLYLGFTVLSYLCLFRFVIPYFAAG